MKIYIDAELNRHLCNDWTKWNNNHRKKYIDDLPAVLIHDGNGIMEPGISVKFCPYCGQKLEADKDGTPEGIERYIK